jgi:glycosyltransferase involved in cell wall biosynthesis
VNILFVHNNFPAQYRHLAAALARDPKVRVCAISAAASPGLKGVKTLKYSLDGADVAATHPFARRFDLESRRAEQVLYALSSLTAAGFAPDVIMAHPGWGETLPLRALFPRARFILYCEFFYGATDRDVGFDPEFAETGVDGHVALHAKNAATLLALTHCDVGVSPTPWQRSTFPNEFQHKIRVIHEGVDVDLAKPADDATFLLPSGRTLRRSDEVVTFVARNLEPLRGYHIFMRALPRIMALRPHAQILVIGADGVSYGAPPPPGTSWREKFFAEVSNEIDGRRIHFTGSLPYRDYLAALQVSSAHVYLTYPFVLSWSLIEAMSAGCLVIGSDTEPVRDIIDDRNGLLTPFFDPSALADRVVEVLANSSHFQKMRARARQTALERFDLQRICLPQMLAFVRDSEIVRPRAAARSARRSDRRISADASTGGDIGTGAE